MCDQDAKQPFAMHFNTQSQPTGSRRRRLWELPYQCHCPVVGVCVPLGTLRQLVNKTLGGKVFADDYEMHVGTVAECGRRNRLSEVLQHELEHRYARTIQAFRLAKTRDALAQLWTNAVEQGDVAGAFWAALSHPRCDDEIQEILCRDMHMLQHQAGACVRADLNKFNSLLDENAVLTRELGRVQGRSTRLMVEKAGEIERLHAQILQLRAQNIGKDSSIAFLTEDLAALKAAIPALELRARLQKKNDQLTVRQTALETHNSELRKNLAYATKSLETMQEELAQLRRADGGEQQFARSIPIAVHLHQKAILCVGGRSGNIANYRDIIERVGGRFTHHDGGLEDNPNLLDASLAAADLVICQTGCISHNAYWRVKDFCKRTGKRCVFVENPSASSLARGLEQWTAEDTEAILADKAEAKYGAADH